MASQVIDCKPKRPNWGMLSSGEVHSTTIAAWGHLVLLGDADGNLNKWDTTTSVTPPHLLQQHHAVVSCAVLCCAVLCCAVLCCAVLCYAAMGCAAFVVSMW